MKRIFYFNITYSCNSNCIFCYSHNTHHSPLPYRELTFDKFKNYINIVKPNVFDRIIINGGEPLVHNEIKKILLFLKDVPCEKLIYTNGRLLANIAAIKFDNRFRFIVPIHGYQEIHDSITRVMGSYNETLQGLQALRKQECMVDIKIILNEKLISSNDNIDIFLNKFNDIYFNNDIHLTRMAATIVSKKNDCKFVDNEMASYYTEVMLLYFLKKGYSVKIFDTCIKNIQWLRKLKIKYLTIPYEVFFKDRECSYKIDTAHHSLSCEDDCINSKYCISAVNEYKVLKIRRNMLIEDWE